MIARSASMLSVCFFVVALLGSAAAQGEWRKGRATYYGLDGWTIHKAACGLGYQYKNIGTGWDVAAIADASPEFAGSCGRCYEVRCQPRSKVIDGYGNSFSREECKAGDASVVVRTVDNCPCNYPGNAYSNKRWCCGDNSNTQGTHFDLSIWAFEKIADVKQGLAAIEWRRVPCDYRPSNPAPDGPTKMPPSEHPSRFGASGSPYAPDDLEDVYQQKLVMRFDSDGARQGALTPLRGDKPASKVVTKGEVLSKNGGVQSSSSASASASASSSTSSDNGCTDVAPKGSTCKQQKDNKQCSQPWLLSGNYCRATCGRCKLLSGTASSSSSSSASSGGGSSSSKSSASSDSGSSCGDKAPPGEAGCSQQKAWGKCDDGYIKSGGYCQRTCGRCGGSEKKVQASSKSHSSSG